MTFNLIMNQLKIYFLITSLIQIKIRKLMKKFFKMPKVIQIQYKIKILNLMNFLMKIIHKMSNLENLMNKSFSRNNKIFLMVIKILKKLWIK